jgi:hypothetical protein
MDQKSNPQTQIIKKTLRNRLSKKKNSKLSKMFFKTQKCDKMDSWKLLNLNSISITQNLINLLHLMAITKFNKWIYNNSIKELKL